MKSLADEVFGEIKLAIGPITAEQEAKLNKVLEKVFYHNKKQELENIIKEYSLRYPDGDFSFMPYYSSSGESVEGTLMFDWKSQIYHIECEPIEEVIELIRSLKK